MDTLTTIDDLPLDTQLARARQRISLLEHYVGKTANRLGVADPSRVHGDLGALENVGEETLAALERLRDAGQDAGTCPHLLSHRSVLGSGEVVCMACSTGLGRSLVIGDAP